MLKTTGGKEDAADHVHNDMNGWRGAMVITDLLRNVHCMGWLAFAQGESGRQCRTAVAMYNTSCLKEGIASRAGVTVHIYLPVPGNVQRLYLYSVLERNLE